MEDIHPELDDSHYGSKSNKGTLGKLTNTFNNLRESFSSAQDQDHTIWTARSGYAYDIRLLFKRRITNLYISFTNLRSYVEVNYSGFRKIIKKYVFNMSFLCLFLCNTSCRPTFLYHYPWLLNASHSCLDFWMTCSWTSAVGSLGVPWWLAQVLKILLYFWFVINLVLFFSFLASNLKVVLSRYDKVTYSELKDRYLHNVVEVSLPFTQAAKDRLNDNVNDLLELYAKCVTRGDKTAARQQLRLHQRENIAWERDTVWRQMIGRQRRGEDDTQAFLGATLVQPPEPTVVDIPTPVGRFKITKRNIFKVAALAIFIFLLNVQVVERPEANHCFAILTFCTILWATEVNDFLFLLVLFVFFLIRRNRLFHFSWRRCLLHCFLSCSESSATKRVFKWLLQKPQSKLNQTPLFVTQGLIETGSQIRFLGYVLTDCHAAHRRLHYLIGFKQDQHRSCHNHSRPKFSRYKTKHSHSCIHGSILFCEHVDQVRFFQVMVIVSLE